jgi:hypothetical protein
MSYLKLKAREAALIILHAASKKRTRWSDSDRNNFTRAFNSLQRLAGKKIMMRGEKLVAR